MGVTGSWLPAFWTAVAFNVTAAALAVLWLKPRVTRLVKEQAAFALSQGAAANAAVHGDAVKAASVE
jgi:hypothetical protein